MKLHIIASGSSGNCACIENDNYLLFIDAGSTLTSVKKALAEDDINTSKPAYLFITHEHRDHIQGIGPLCRKFSPKIFTSKKTASYLLNSNTLKLDNNNIYALQEGKNTPIDNYFSVTPFKTSHDACQPFGYKFNINGKIVSFLTDCGIISQSILDTIQDTEFLLLESNYDDDMLDKNDYPYYLKQRIHSHKGHLSNNDAFQIVAKLSNFKLKHCLLGHVSEHSNDYTLLEKYATDCKKCFDVDAKVLRQKTHMLVNI